MEQNINLEVLITGWFRERFPTVKIVDFNSNYQYWTYREFEVFAIRHGKVTGWRYGFSSDGLTASDILDPADPNFFTDLEKLLTCSIKYIDKLHTNLCKDPKYPTWV